jgi:putative flippase GtrA
LLARQRRLRQEDTMLRALAPLFAEPSRPLRFLCVGALATVTQLGLLAGLTALGWSPALANGLGLLAATQVNFALSSVFTWRDRRRTRRTLPLRWARFMGLVATTLLLNEAVFLAARVALPTLVAAGLGSGLMAVLNFTLGDRFVFLR